LRRSAFQQTIEAGNIEAKNSNKAIVNARAA